jgi:hypothetical protein
MDHSHVNRIARAEFSVILNACWDTLFDLVIPFAIKLCEVVVRRILNDNSLALAVFLGFSRTQLEDTE